MGDGCAEPPSALVLDNTSAPRSRHRYRPGRPARSAEQTNVCTDVPPDASYGRFRSFRKRETPCQRHVSPRSPIRFETTVDTSVQPRVRRRVPRGRVASWPSSLPARTATPPAPTTTSHAVHDDADNRPLWV